MRKIKSFNVCKPVVIIIDDCKISGKGIQKCLNIQWNLENLKTLNLCIKKLKIGRNKLGGTGIKWITKFFMPNLEKIYLRCYHFIQILAG